MSNFDPTSQIRVLVLDAGPEATPLSFNFEFVDVETKSCPQDASWEAISYRWDSYGELHNIQVKDGMLQIHDNVFRMLNDLRLPGQQRRLWIDAICINQTDEREKEEQVQLMRYVYEKAHQVIIWLDGKRHKNEASAVISASCWTDRICRLSHTLPADRSLQQAFIAENPDIPWRGPFHEILNHAWFKRIWVVQEAAFAGSLLVHMNNQTIPWDTFASAALKFMSLAPASEAIHKDPVECYAICQEKNFTGGTLRGLEMVHLILSLRSWAHLASVPIPPSEMALLCRGRQATDGRDMIYGIRGFFGLKKSPRGEFSLPVDYTLSSDELYKRFVCWCIQREGNLDILAQTRNEEGRNIRLPTWITDWNAPDIKAGLFRALEITPTIPVLQKLDYLNQAYPVDAPVYRRENDTLVVRGFIFDEISEHEFIGSSLRKYSLMNDEKSEEFYLRLWKSMIPKNAAAANSLLFGEEQPTVSTVKELYDHTCERDQFTSHLWRDEYQANQRVRKANPEFRGHFLTKRGCLASMFPVFFGEKRLLKVCYLLGGRGLFILVPPLVAPASGPQLYSLGCGDCFINGFEDGKGYDICRSLGLQEEDIHIV